MKAIIAFLKARAKKWEAEGDAHRVKALAAKRKPAERERELLAQSHCYTRASEVLGIVFDLDQGAAVLDPIPMLLYCPQCGERHIDRGDFASKRHHTHACQSCGFVWRPAVVATVGVQFLPGFKDGASEMTVANLEKTFKAVEAIRKLGSST